MSDDGVVVTKRGRKANTDKTDKNEKKPAESKKRTKTVTKEESNDASPVKKSRGRPKGTTKKKTAAKAKPKGTSGPGRRGRPKKDSPKDSEDEDQEEEEGHERKTCPLSPANKIINIKEDPILLPYVSNSNVNYAEVIQNGRSEEINKEITQELEERQSATKKNKRSLIRG
ncbi:hypothetical protein WA026_002696 [Henosepilachna vigintioctopunctata]|uniref:Uncharacterized protein n=1 Tax=Henosepilachna vigintioctopunctata TaxID=420089 RepID=A0AAW1TS25_9CUCU